MKCYNEGDGVVVVGGVSNCLANFHKHAFVDHSTRVFSVRSGTH